MSKSKRKHRSAPAGAGGSTRVTMDAGRDAPAAASPVAVAEAPAPSARGPAGPCAATETPDLPPPEAETATMPDSAERLMPGSAERLMPGSADCTVPESGAQAGGSTAPAAMLEIMEIELRHPQTEALMPAVPWAKGLPEAVPEAVPAPKPEPAAAWLLEEEAGTSPVMPAAAEAERDALLRLLPGRVFRIRLGPDGSVLVTDARSAAALGAEVGNVPNTRGGEPPPAAQTLAAELERQARELYDAFHESGEVQTREIKLANDGQTSYFEVRAAGYAAPGLLAVVHNGQTTYRQIGASAGAADDLLVMARDITAAREAEASIARTQDEVTRLNEVLENEASIHAEDEEIMENAFRKLGRLLEDTIGAIQMIVQTKDPPTARHQARVCKLACAIGRQMALDKSQVDTIGLAALLHDLGKILVPNDMLNKPGKLTERELSAIRNSAETEYQILKTIDLFCPIADIVHQHHERLDGSGYPLGLKGEDILLEARIIAVADVVEAMMSERPYRPALSLGAALKEIEENKGKLYDPHAVEACRELFRRGGFEFDGPEDALSQEGAYSGA